MEWFSQQPRTEKIILILIAFAFIYFGTGAIIGFSK